MCILSYWKIFSYRCPPVIIELNVNSINKDSTLPGPSDFEHELKHIKSCTAMQKWQIFHRFIIQLTSVISVLLGFFYNVESLLTITVCCNELTFKSLLESCSISYFILHLIFTINIFDVDVVIESFDCIFWFNYIFPRSPWPLWKTELPQVCQMRAFLWWNLGQLCMSRAL